MGPLLSLLGTVTAAGVIATAIFIITVFLLPWRLALRIAGSATIGGAIGFAGTMFVQAPFYPATISSRPAIVSLLGFSALGGLAGALICAVMLFRLSQRKH